MRLQKVTRDSLPHIAGSLWRLACSQVTTWVGRYLVRWWGVSIGRSCRFNGVPVVRRLPGSRIEIGSSCVFTSKSAYNVIGVNHPAILATLSHHGVIKIGNGCGFSGTTIGCDLSISIGNHVRCGANTVITDTDWHTDDPRTTPSEPVVIEDNVWLGLNVTVLKGVVIGKDSVIATGSIVTRSIPAGVVAAGVPAKVIRKLERSPTDRDALLPK